MLNKHSFIPSLVMTLLCLILFQSCASTGYSLREPHYYSNSYDQVISAIEKVLAAENMVIMNAENLSDTQYKIYFFKKSARIDEQDFETGSTAEILIEKVSDTRTTVEIEEQNDRALVRDEYREHLARDIFKGLEDALVLIDKSALSS